MPPVSSLIFVVILAVWAVYLVQHWVRRRDHLATARSVDRFSESMRVLERRRALPKPDLTEPAPRSYSVSPLRPARPQVVVKRGAAAPTAPAALAAPAGSTAVAPSPAFRRARLTARLRAGGLILGSLAMVTLVGLSLAKVYPSWAALVGIGVFALAVAGVRWSASREQQARRRAVRGGQARPLARPVLRPGAQLHTSTSGMAESVAPETAAPETAAPETAAELQSAPAHEFARQSVAATTRTARRAVLAAELYDVEEVEAAMTEVVLPAEPEVVTPPVVAQAAPGSWEPVPVPPPTYTLKARAYRQAPTGSAQLPVDGTEMALEEEFEELPRIDRVG